MFMVEIITLFSKQILAHVPLRGFLILKFNIFDGTTNPYDYLMHYVQVMTFEANPY